MSDFMKRVQRYASYLDDDAARGMLTLAEAGITDIRTLNCAAHHGVNSLEDFARFTEAELLRWDNFGKRSLNLVKETLQSNGLTLSAGDMGDTLLRGLLQMASETKEALRIAGEDHRAALAAVEARRRQLNRARHSA